MAIVKMKRLHMLALRADRNDLFDKLQQLGCLEVSEQGEKLLDPAWKELTHRDEDALNLRTEQLSTVSRAISILEQYAPEKKRFLSARPQIQVSELFDDSALERALELATELCGLRRELTQTEEQIQKLNAQIKSLMPWQGVDIPLDMEPTRVLYTAFGIVPSGVVLEFLEEDMQQQADTCQLEESSRDSEAHYLFVMCHRAQEEECVTCLRSYGFSSLSFQGLTGTAEENVTRLSRELLELEKSRDCILDRLSSYGEGNSSLRLAFDRISQEVQKETSKQRLLSTEKVFCLEGWATEESVPALIELFRDYECAYEFVEPQEEEYPQVPVSLKNGKIISSLNAVTNMYALPAYGTLDPNPLMAPFFILFFGMMMADMAYGLLMFFGCMFAIKKMRPKGGTYQLLSLIQYCGVTSFVFGALTGGFFGDMIPQLVKMVSGQEISLPHVFSPVDDAVAVLVGSLVLGVIQIFTGMGINMYKQIRQGQVMEAVCGDGAWFAVFALLGVAFLTGAVKFCVIAVVVVLVLTQGYGKEGIGGKLAGIGGSLYNHLTGYFSDILSYSRLMALMLSGAVIAQVFNTLGTLTGNVVGFLVIAMIGNMLNFALNLLSCYVHDLRLQCLEFFGHFYEDGGKAFAPVAIDTKYVDIIQ